VNCRQTVPRPPVGDPADVLGLAAATIAGIALSEARKPALQVSRIAGLPRRRRQSIAATHPAYLAAVLGVGLVHLWGAQTEFGITARLLAWVHCCIALESARRFWAASVRQVPLLPMLTAQFYLAFGLQVFFPPALRLVNGWYTPEPRALTWALLVSVLCELVIVLSYGWGSGFLQAKVPVWRLLPRLSAEWSRSAYAYAFVATSVWCIEKLSPSLIPVEVRQIVDSVFDAYLALAVLFCLYYRFQNRISGVVGVAMLVTMSFTGLVHGMMETVLVPFYVVAVCGWLWRGRIPVKWLVAGAVIFVVLNPVKVRYRQLAWSDKEVSDASQMRERVDSWSVATQEFLDDPFMTEKAVDRTASRLGGLLQVAQVLDTVPSVEAYKLGDGWSTALTYFIPRVLWKDKPPSTTLNDRYAIQFGYSTLEGTASSTTGVLLPVEGHWDFGLAGVVGYSAVYGLLLVILLGYRAHAAEAGLLTTLAFSAHFFQMFQALSIFVAAICSTLTGLCLGLWLLHLGASRGERYLARASAAHRVTSSAASGGVV
jgi:hypothetical protein